jgi:sugar O-acyltransferase (sialic acid O-acetyltransferase NeuD family)
MKTIIWGGTGHAKVLREFVGRAGYEVVAVFDNNPAVSSPFADVPLYHGREGFDRWREGREELMACLVAIGGARGRDRVELQRFLDELGFEPVTVVHPAAYVATDATLGRGCQVLAGAVVASEAVLGKGCIINTAASVDHECVLGEGVHVGPGATLAGCVSVGDYSFVGAGAVVLPRVKIGRNVIVGAGAVVTREVPDDKVVYGNPARVRRDNIDG